MTTEIIEEKYKLNPNKWEIVTTNIIEEKYKLNPNKWVIHQKTTINKTKKHHIAAVFFIICLISVSFIKNETRKLEKDINILLNDIRETKIILHEATLDHQYLTSPENISNLAKEHLETDFTFYKKNQIKNLNEKNLSNIKTINKRKLSKTELKVTKKIKTEIQKTINEKKIKMKKLKVLYENPEEIPDAIKTQVAKRVKAKKKSFKSFIENPKESISKEKLKNWGTFQIVKAFLGIPIIPGR